MRVDAVKNQKLIKKISEMARQYDMTTEQVWHKLILRYDNVSGKAAANHGDQEKRVMALAKFFSQVFVKEDFNDDDIYENRKCCIQLT